VKEDTWETEASFNNPLTITRYWNTVKELEQLEQERRAKLFAAGPVSKKEVNKSVEMTKCKRALDNKKATQKRSKRLNTGLYKQSIYMYNEMIRQKDLAIPSR
jgi:hypothetical protein